MRNIQAGKNPASASPSAPHCPHRAAGGRGEDFPPPQSFLAKPCPGQRRPRESVRTNISRWDRGTGSAPGKAAETRAAAGQPGILAAAPACDPQLCRLNSDDTGATGGQSCSADGLRVQERTPRSCFWAPFFSLVPLLTTPGSCLWPGTPGWDSGATPVTRGKGKAAPGVQQPPSCPVGPVALG